MTVTGDQQRPATRRPRHSQYQRDGFVVRRSVISSDDVEHARRETDRLFADPALTAPDDPGTRVRGSLSGATVVDRIERICDLSPCLRDLARVRAVLQLATTALGEEPVLFKDKVIRKCPGTAGYLVHQDYMRWQAFPPPADAMVTLAISLDHATHESGTICVSPGQHGRLLTPPGETADPDPRDVDVSRDRVVELHQGDALALHPLLPHRSDYNRSAGPRRILFFTYSAARYGDLRAAYYERHAEIFGPVLGPEVVATPIRSAPR